MSNIPGAIVTALFKNAQVKEIKEIDPQQEALLFAGYLLRDELPTAWKILENGQYHCARFTDVDGTVLYYVAQMEQENPVFSATYDAQGNLTYDVYERGPWETDLSLTYKVARSEEMHAVTAGS